MVAKYAAYPEYKDSGVEWLGEIPKHWEVNSLKYMVSTRKGIAFKAEEFQDSGIPVVKASDIKELTIKKPDIFLPNSYFNLYKKAILKEGNIILSTVGSNPDIKNSAVGQIGRLPSFLHGSLLNQNTVIFEANESTIDEKYLFYLLRTTSYRDHLDLNAHGTANQSSLNISDMLDFRISLPSFQERRQIANFLDHETAKIDTLIEKQQQLITLLKEKRQAVISHAVTKGLNPNVKMKDSGVEWLGEVPEGWKVAQLKFNTLEMQTGPFGSQLHAEDYIEDGIPLINPAHMSEGLIIPDLKVTVDTETANRLSRHKLKEGDLILARRGELGRCAVVRDAQKNWLCGTGSLKATLNKKLIPDYAYLLITSDGVIAELSLESKGSTMDNLNTETLGRIRMPIPSIKEQKDILDYVELIADKFKKLMEKAQHQIELLQERRTALISAAVTGKIDVRGWQAPHP